ncbi:MULTISPECIES: TetR/AcrR family transcriptional regulator [Streptomyces]|uniref:TetR/AcrR family transcriptional regulator n=1 Tax=Streptomyces tendae TaxID=1932 RepID=A0A6B3QN99_STRTE|nr:MULTISPECIES: TetR/AcrR family transcriptional regulator [Streptomyces]MBQ0966203.1 TetR/AcrR family transcriptional regulator [Streptomyces sp. RK74B]MBQ1006056.1 TetR/AcrR family transcriptional regulator [Streptomyces sp. RK23]NEV88600.1 TetR/AcrR family transcriptional regulator [Streptomyces tendae]BET48450.1 TetR/AcrR family transcriptional regulator [Kitasatospora aureofaciens]
MSPKQHRGEVTSDLLLDAALRLYTESGEQGVTVTAVTRTSGVSLGSLYHHFGSLDGLLTALTERWTGRLLEQLVTALTSAGTARAGIRAVVGAYLAFVRDHPGAALLVHSPRADRRLMARGQEVRDAQQPTVSAMAGWIQPRIDAGEIAPLPMPLLETLVLGPVVAVARRRLSGVRDVDLDEAARILPERIWRSISADGA